MHGLDQASPDEGGIDVAGEQFGDRGILEIPYLDDPCIVRAGWTPCRRNSLACSQIAAERTAW
jgi:hypothetical protein